MKCYSSWSSTGALADDTVRKAVIKGDIGTAKRLLRMADSGKYGFGFVFYVIHCHTVNYMNCVLSMHMYLNNYGSMV